MQSLEYKRIVLIKSSKLLVKSMAEISGQKYRISISVSEFDILLQNFIFYYRISNSSGKISYCIVFDTLPRVFFSQNGQHYNFYNRISNSAQNIKFQVFDTVPCVFATKKATNEIGRIIQLYESGLRDSIYSNKLQQNFKFYVQNMIFYNFDTNSARQCVKIRKFDILLQNIKFYYQKMKF